MSARSDRPLSIAVSHPAAETCIVSLSGDLDIASSVEFSEKLESLTATSPLHVILEIAGVEFIDSSGLNALVVAARDTDRTGGSLVVAAPSRYVARVFHLVRMEESLDVVGSVEEALAATGTRHGEAAS